MRTRPALPLVLAGILSLTGCGRGTGEVSGRITRGEQPVKSGSVTIYTDAGPRSGRIDPFGGYVVRDVPPGTGFVVTVISPDPRKAQGPRGKPDDAVTQWFPLPKEFADPARSPLRLDVRAGENRFDMKLD